MFILIQFFQQVTTRIQNTSHKSPLDFPYRSPLGRERGRQGGREAVRGGFNPQHEFMDPPLGEALLMARYKPIYWALR